MAPRGSGQAGVPVPRAEGQILAGVGAGFADAGVVFADLRVKADGVGL
jgi:hypothetical protein